VVQTTGQRTDPITCIVSAVSADFGRLYVDTSCHSDDDCGPDGDPVVTSTRVETGGITGELISRGDLISEIVADRGKRFTGVIAVQGNFGKIFTPTGQTVPMRLGGLYCDVPFSGDLVVLGQVLADMQFNRGLKGGRIAAKGGIVGNLLINGGLDSGSAVVSGGEIGDPTLGTQFIVNGRNKGILAAKGTMNFGETPPRGEVFNNASGVNAAAIDAIFTNNGHPLSFDLTDNLDLGGLALILAKLSSLHVGSDGNLTGPIP
jgi:hypothetical protein